MLVGDPKQQLLCAIPLAIIADAISPASLTLKRFCVIRNVQGNTFATLLVAPSRDDCIGLCRWLVSSHHPVWVEEGGRTNWWRGTDVMSLMVSWIGIFWKGGRESLKERPVHA